MKDLPLKNLPKNNLFQLTKIAFLAFLLLFGIQLKAQSTLSVGDLVFIGYNADILNDDGFSILLLEDISAGTEIFFTDLGWTGTAFQGTTSSCGANMGAASDGIIKWTANSAINCGTEIFFDLSDVLGVNIGTVTGIQPTFNFPLLYITLASGGDQIFAYQGSLQNPSIIAGIYMNSPAWDPLNSACEYNSSRSALPSTLVGFEFTIQPEVDNGKYNCAINSGTASIIRDAILGSSNWVTDNSTPFSYPVNCSFTCNVNAPVITMHPTDAEVCPNLPATFSVTATNATSYQWEVNSGTGFTNASGSPYSGTTTNTLTIDPILGLNGYEYRCQVGGTNGSASSLPATLTELPPPSITLQPINAIACAGCTSGFYIEAEGDNLTYQWQFDDGSGFINVTDDAFISGSNTNKLIIADIGANTGAFQYKCLITGTCSPSVETNNVSFDLSGGNTSLQAGDVAFLAYNVDEPAGFEDNFSLVLLEDIQGGTEINITDFGWTDNNQFRDECGGTLPVSDGTIKWLSTSNLSCGAEIVINGKSKLTASSGIVQGITASTGNALEYISFSTSGDQLFAYQGSHQNPTLLSGIHFADDAGWNSSYTCSENTATKSILPSTLTPGFSAIAVTVNGAEIDNARYDCSIISGSTASIRTAIMNEANWLGDDSNPFPLPINCGIGCSDGSPNITMQPQDVEICEGLSTNFSITAANADSYQWQGNANTGAGWQNIMDNADFQGASTQTLSITDVSNFNGEQFRCIATNSIGSSTSQPGTLTVLFEPNIIKQPETAQSCIGCSSGFVVEASGDGLTYEWFVSSNGGVSFTPTTDGVLYSGSSTNKLELSSITGSEDGNIYHCIVSGSCGSSVQSNSASLTLTGNNQSLMEGDLSFVSFNADDSEDNFSFVLLTSITGGTEIHITDFGWTNDNAFQNCPAGQSALTDGIITWIATESYPCGTEINIQGKTKLTSNEGVVFGTQATSSNSLEYINILGGGDQLFAYQGAFSSPILIAGFENSGGWESSLTNCEVTSSKSILPSSLTTGFSAMEITPEVDNIKYDCSNIVQEDPSVLRAAFHDQSNFLEDNTNPFLGPINCNFSCCTNQNTNIVYVDVSATGSNTGLSWTDAYTSLQDALDAARSCGVPSSILLANGVYYPDQGATVTVGDRTSSFVIDFVTQIEGGYDPVTGLQNYNGETILSGNIGNHLINTDNSEQILRVLQDASISNLTVEGAYNDNNSNVAGGGIYANDGSFINLIIRNNHITATNGLGGGVYASGNGIIMEGVLIHNNSSPLYGGGISLENSIGSNILKNVTIADNVSANNGGIDVNNITVDISNSIMFNNTPSGITLFNSTVNAEHSILETSTVWPGIGNFNSDPNFINSAQDNYQISTCSDAWQNGKTSSAPSSSLDLQGNSRIKQSIIDIGAFEVQSSNLRSQITLTGIVDYTYSCTKVLDFEIPASQPNVAYSLYTPTLEGPFIGDGTDLILSSAQNITEGFHFLRAERNGANKLSFADNKRVTIPYDADLALSADEDFTLEVGFNVDNTSSVKRFYSQEGSIGIGLSGSNVIITRYAIVDVFAIAIGVQPNTDHVLKIEQKIIGPDLVRFFVSLDGVLKWTGTQTRSYFANTNPINIGGRLNSQWVNGDLDFIEIKKGRKIVLRYDFTTGYDSETVYDLRTLSDGETPRNGSMIGFTPSTDWVSGGDTLANLCVPAQAHNVTYSPIPVNHTVNDEVEDGFESLKFKIEHSCPNDTIRFNPLLDNSLIISENQILISHDLNIIGNGSDKTSLLCTDNNRYFNIPAPLKILMKDLKFQNNINTTGEFFISDDHTLEDVIFSGYPLGELPVVIDGLSNLKIKGEVRIQD